MPFLNSGYTWQTMLIVSVEAERINKRNAITYGRILKVLCQFFGLFGSCSAVVILSDVGFVVEAEMNDTIIGDQSRRGTNLF